MRTITVTGTRDIRRRANGSVAYFRGSVEADGRDIPDFKIQTKLGDEGADDIRIDGDVLTMPEAVAVRIIGKADAHDDAKADLQERILADEERLHGHILNRLRPLVAVSEAQRDSAETKRRAAVIRMSKEVTAAPGQDEEEFRLQALFWDEAAAETNARFWLDYDAVFGPRDAMAVLIERANAAYDMERAAG